MSTKVSYFFDFDLETQWVFMCFKSFLSKARGVTVLFNYSFELINSIERKKIKKVIFLALHLSINKNKFSLINIYGPNSDIPDSPDF